MTGFGVGEGVLMGWGSVGRTEGLGIYVGGGGVGLCAGGDAGRIGGTGRGGIPSFVPLCGTTEGKGVFAAARDVERRAKNQVITATNSINKIIMRSVIRITLFSFE